MGLENWDFDCAISHVNKLQEQILKLREENKRLAAPFGTLQEPLPLKSGKWSRDLVKTEFGWARIEGEYAEDVETGKRNDEINAANQALVASIRKVIVEAGFPESHVEYKRNKLNRVPSGWAVGIRVTPGHATLLVESRMKEYREYREKFLAEKAKAEAESERVKQAEADRRAADIEFVDLCRAVGLDPVSTGVGDLKDAIRSKCKYLDLAVAGMETRGDWSDGCWRVENALSEFEVVTPEDKAIHEDWWSECNDFDDGRQFRDCTWNYDRIISELADSTAVALWGRFAKIRVDLNGSR
jgi:hypothetical protein